MPALRIQRINAFADWLRAYQVVLDGEVVGRIRNGGQFVLDVAPGRHEVSLKIDWMGSNTLTFEAGEAPVELECGCRLRGKQLLLRGPAILLGSSGDYLWLRHLDTGEDRST